VNVHIRIWTGDALTVPVGALFRQDEKWAVFRVADGRAQATAIEISHRNNEQAEVRAGLREGDQVILHPSDRITEGVSVVQRDVR
jgi:HlyD family secretion protein